ncbi:AEC family transporter [Azospirillum sp. RWY-5-1]|uniref:AEC family transporter n=1 Tax=Azospirillum oleiclasticum TaxID=2735135 RepID=A0ABX2TFX8_9PROT|nr:AEC family transporter [Azospirillum oleiclasticum]NYZ17159.1 AEC family transporter [Azospirillum oleiclasticum]NYZ23131.1 AEC family transporter [Azospirillum oleiclasticum]
MDFLGLLSAILAVVAPVMIVAAVGFAWIRGGLPYDNAFITTFAISLSTPCLVFTALARARIDHGELLAVTTAAALCMAGAALVSWPLLAAAGLRRSVYLPAMAFPNAGNLGIPICLFAFGELGLSYAVLFMAVLAVAQFTIGPAVAAGRPDLRMLARTPVLYAVAAGLAVQLGGLHIPVWLGNTTKILGDCAVPLMLFSLGVALARLRLGGALRVMAVSALRIGLGALVGVAVTWAMGLEGVLRGVVIVESAMPVAVFNYLWALRYNNGPEEVAGMVMGSTVLSFLTLPLLLAVLL